MTVSTAYPLTSRAAGVAIETKYKNLGAAGTKYRPVRIAVMGQAGSTYSGSMAKRQVFTKEEVGDVYGYTSPLYLISRILLPSNGDGVGDIPVWIYPLTVTTGTAAIHDITPTGSTATIPGRYYVKVNNLLSGAIDVVVGETVATWIGKAVLAVNRVIGMPGTASDGTTTLDFTAGWEGDTGDNIVLEVIEPDDAEFSFAYTQPTAGAGTIAVDAASEGVNLIGEAWDTHVINALDYTDSTNLDAFQTFGDGRWLPETRKPLVVFTGTNEPTLATVTAVTDARSTDKVNAIVPNPGSNDLPFVIAADHVRRIAQRANVNPPYGYGRSKLDNLSAALDSVQWSSSQREAAIDAGLGSIRVRDRVVTISDVVTCWHPSGEDPPAYSKAVNIEKIATMIYQFELEFNSEKWDSVPLVPDDQSIRNPAAKKPKDAVAAMHQIFDNAALDAIISDPDFAKENSTATIGTTNPDRLDIVATFKLSGNVKVIPITLNFGFYYGGAA